MSINPSLSVKVDINGDEKKPPATDGNTPTPMFVVNVSKSGTQTPKEDEPWELDCEICHRRGMNLVGPISCFKT
jgi:hypothetical protein